MNGFLLAAAVIVALVFVIRGFATANPKNLAKNLRRFAGIALLLFAGFLTLTGRWIAAIPLVMFAVSILGLNRSSFGTIGTFGGSQRTQGGRRSTVRSAALEMQLDHDSGIMSGRVLAGRFEGLELARMSMIDLKQLWREVRSDQDSRSLLEAYLDRRDAFWREDLKDDPAAGQSRARASGAMTEQEAYQILGLEAGAGDAEIRDAHRRLMKAVHPDMGGSTFLAAKINEAKDKLIGKHRTRSNH